MPLLITMPVTSFPNTQQMTNANHTGINPNFSPPTFTGTTGSDVNYGTDGAVTLTLKTNLNNEEGVISSRFGLGGSFDEQFDIYSASISGSPQNVSVYHTLSFYNNVSTSIGWVTFGYKYEWNSGMSFISFAVNGDRHAFAWDPGQYGRGTWGTWRLTFDNSTGTFTAYVKPQGASSWTIQYTITDASFIPAVLAVFNFSVDSNYATEVLKLNNYTINSVGSIVDNLVQSVLLPISNYNVTGSPFENRYIRYSEFTASNGSLYTWGANDQGQIGNSTNTNDFYSPEHILSNSFITIGGTQNSWYAIDTNGALWAWGSNGNGQLGTNDLIWRFNHTQVGTFTTWKALSRGCYSAHELAIATDGSLYSAGYGAQGQLGLGNFDPSTQVFTKVGSATNWKQVACANTASFAINTLGELYSCGNGASWTGILGLGSNVNYNTFQRVGSDSDWVKVAAGYNHAVAIKNGNLYGWGQNGSGQLGIALGTYYSPVNIDNNNWIDVACGAYFTVAIKADGTLWSTGFNSYGELGQGDFGNQKTSFSQVGSATNWQSIACGTDHSIGIKTDGTMWAWGYNAHGELGIGTNGESHIPVQIKTPIVQWTNVVCGNEDSMAIGY